MSVPDTSVVLAKVEPAYGIWAAPTGAADAMIVNNYVITPMESQQVRRAVERPFPGTIPSTYTAIRARHAFNVELAGTGTPGTSVGSNPFWFRLLQGCFFGAPFASGSGRGISPATAGDGSSLSILGTKGELVRARARGARGNAVFTFEEKGIPNLALDFIGLIEGATPIDAGSAGAITLPGAAIGQEVSLLNTSVSLGGFVLGVRRLTIDIGNKPEFYSTTGSRAIVYGKDETGDRRATVGQAVFELPNPATRNFFADIIPRTPLAFSLTHGLTAGNIVKIDAPAVVLGEANFSVETNRLFMNCPLEFLPVTGGDELLIDVV